MIQLQELATNPFMMAMALKLVLDFKWKGKDIVDLFPDSMKAGSGMIVANAFGIIAHLISGDITLSGLSAAATQGLQNYTVAGGLATGLDQVVMKWNKTHGINGTKAIPPAQ